MELLAREAELLALIISDRHVEEGGADGEKRLLVLLALLRFDFTSSKVNKLGMWF